MENRSRSTKLICVNLTDLKLEKWYKEKADEEESDSPGFYYVFGFVF